MKKLLFWSGVLFLTGLLICFGILFALKFDYMRLDTAGTNSGTLDIGAEVADWSSIRHIDVSGTSCDVIVRPSPDGKARVEYDTPGHINVTAEVDGDRLVITGIDRAARQPWYKQIRLEIRPHTGITIYLPAYVANHSYETLDIRTGSGDVLVWGGIVANQANVTTSSGDVNFRIDTKDSLTVSSTSGDVELSSFTGRHLSVTTTSGDVQMARLTLDGRVSLQTVSGEMDITHTEASYFTATTVSGDIELEKSGGTILMELQTTSGDVDVDAIKKYKLYTSSTSGKIHVADHQQVAEDISNCQIFTVSGDITVK